MNLKTKIYIIFYRRFKKKKLIIFKQLDKREFLKKNFKIFFWEL